MMMGDKNETTLKGLAKSMEKSGLDQLILTDVFRKLPRLTAGHVDNEAYRTMPTEVDGARCGLRYIFSSSTEYNFGSSQRGTNRAYHVVLTSLRTAGLAGKIKLHLYPTVVTDYSQYDIFFDPTSIDWKHDFAPSVESLEFDIHVSSRWCLDLMRSVEHIDRLAVKYVVDPIIFSHPDTGMFTWPRLQYLQLESVCCDGQSIANFLHVHKDTIFELALVSVEMITGTWRETLQAILGLSKLAFMEFSDPSETTNPPPPDPALDRFSNIQNPDVHTFYLRDKTKIDLMINVVLSDLRTTSWNCDTNHYLAVLYKLDMRLAHAVLDGKAERRDGRCYLLV
ncbi:hypothetical protein IQ06DRAFT_135700 [Phaeosphaeriaceae sp. SRC1lsM3a]|nr:hypothetical protein IQ06DRAFT_135700 [Stagonospora sp. SRC1lsM3a]